MHFIKNMLLLSFTFTCVSIGMENRDTASPSTLKDTSCNSREEQSERERQDTPKQYTFKTFFNIGMDNRFLDQVIFAKDYDAKEFAKQHEAYVEYAMAPSRARLSSLADIVCKDLKIESRSHMGIILGCMHAPQGTVEAKALRNFVTLMHAIDRVEELTPKDRDDLCLMLAMKKPIEVDYLRKALKLPERK